MNLPKTQPSYSFKEGPQETQIFPPLSKWLSPTLAQNLVKSLGQSERPSWYLSGWDGLHTNIFIYIYIKEGYKPLRQLGGKPTSLKYKLICLYIMDDIWGCGSSHPRWVFSLNFNFHQPLASHPWSFTTCMLKGRGLLHELSIWGPFSVYKSEFQLFWPETGATLLDGNCHVWRRPFDVLRKNPPPEFFGVETHGRLFTRRKSKSSPLVNSWSFRGVRTVSKSEPFSILQDLWIHG